MAKTRIVAHASPHAGKMRSRPLKKGATLSNRKFRLKLAKKLKARKRVKFDL